MERGKTYKETNLQQVAKRSIVKIDRGFKDTQMIKVVKEYEIVCTPEKIQFEEKIAEIQVMKNEDNITLYTDAGLNLPSELPCFHNSLFH